MKVRILLLTAALLISSVAFSQPYRTGLGFRLGAITSGISIKHFTTSNSAVEGIVSFGRHSFLLTGLYELHVPFPNAENLSWFYGGGFHVGFFSDNYGYHRFYHGSHNHDHDHDDYYDVRTSLGIDFIIGLDYKFVNAPINVGLDVKPFIDFAPGFHGYWEGALSLRFTL